jgi:hypothetical protein
MTYNSTYICTYKSNDIFLEEDNVNDKEKDFILNCLYRNDLLYIFDIEDFENNFNQTEIIGELYNKIKNNTFIISCIKKLNEEFITNNEEVGLMILYSYDYLYLTHPCVSEYLETGQISDTNMCLLKEKIFNNN